MGFPKGKMGKKLELRLQELSDWARENSINIRGVFSVGDERVTITIDAIAISEDGALKYGKSYKYTIDVKNSQMKRKNSVLKLFRAMLEEDFIEQANSGVQ